MKDLNLNIFPDTNKDQWKKLAEKQLKGQNPDEQLKWENDSRMTLEGYYDHSDVSDLQYLDEYFASLPSHRWKLYEEVKVDEPKDANKQVLKALMGGCDGIILNVEDENYIERALNDVDRSICDIAIRSSKKLDVKNSSGMKMIPDGNCLVVRSTNPIEQLLEILGEKPLPFIYRSSNSDFFLEIASVRALNYLLHESNGGDVHIHTHIPNHPSQEHQWFLNTTAGLASVLGGSHSIDFTTAIGDPRISRNTGNLIREESGIEEYTDQCRGSYYIEVLTDKIIKSVKEKLK
ncbi:methylmalonyl-CoA mutase family protein [Ekhidna sp.]|uniref:methylmalonyl-CoA mutase family protein n=1 Tax=Ekhidna sp. TaxID=2608089 RepID=UPI003CCBA2C5